MSNCCCKCECNKPGPKKTLAEKLKFAYWNNDDSSGNSWIAASKVALEHFSRCEKNLLEQIKSLESTNSKLREELIGNVKNMKSQFDGSGLIREGHNVACDSFIRVIEALASKESEGGKP